MTGKCIWCGALFEAKSTKRLYCDDCKKAARLKSIKKCKSRAQKVKRLGKPTLSLKKVLSLQEQYNRENNTRHSYGQFVALLEQGKIKTEEAKTKHEI